MIQASKQIEEFNFNQLCGIAISRLGLSSSDFYELSPGEYYEALYDQQQREKVILEVQTHTIWEAVRINIFYSQLNNPYISKTHKPKRPADVFSFSWEKYSDKTQSVEDMKRVLKIIHENQKGKSELKKRPKSK